MFPFRFRFFMLLIGVMFALYLLCLYLTDLFPLSGLRERRWKNIFSKSAGQQTVKKSPLVAEEEVGYNSSVEGEILSRACHGSISHESVPVHHHHKIWQGLHDGGHEIYLYGAYYDARKAHKHKQFVQILAIGRKLTTSLYCQFWFGGVERMVPSPIDVHHNGRGHNIDGAHYAQYFFSCALPLPHAPTHVAVSIKNCSRPSNILPVLVPEKSRKHDFGICVETSYGHIDPFRIIEWVEFYRMLGVGEINVYPCNMSRNNIDLFMVYEKEGIMKVRLTPSPKRDDTWDGRMVSSPISFNDCMWRNMYRYGYVIPIDFDEVIVPRTCNNYSCMLKEIDGLHGIKTPHQSYTFRNAYFWVTCGTNISSPRNSYALRYIYREPFSAFLFAPKSMVDPRRCLSVFNHYCYIKFPGLNKDWTLDVSTKLALSHHYRVKSGNCKNFEKNKVLDFSVKKFQKTLSKRFRDKITEFAKLGLLSKAIKVT